MRINLLSLNLAGEAARDRLRQAFRKIPRLHIFRSGVTARSDGHLCWCERGSGLGVFVPALKDESVLAHLKEVLRMLEEAGEAKTQQDGVRPDCVTRNALAKAPWIRNAMRPSLRPSLTRARRDSIAALFAHTRVRLRPIPFRGPDYHISRVGVTRGRQSWRFAEKSPFGASVIDDAKIRERVKECLRLANIEKVGTERNGDEVRALLHTGRRSSVICRKYAENDRLREGIQGRTSNWSTTEVGKILAPDTDAQLFAEEEATQLFRRALVRRAMRHAVVIVRSAGALGIRIVGSGRRGGARIWKRERHVEGELTLHNLGADIDCRYTDVRTTYRTVGVQVCLSTGAVADRGGEGKAVGLLMPKRVKFRMARRGRVRRRGLRVDHDVFDESSLQTSWPGWVTTRQGGATQTAASRYSDKKGECRTPGSYRGNRLRQDRRTPGRIISSEWPPWALEATPIHAANTLTGGTLL